MQVYPFGKKKDYPFGKKKDKGKVLIFTNIIYIELMDLLICMFGQLSSPCPTFHFTVNTCFKVSSYGGLNLFKDCSSVGVHFLKFNNL